MFIAPHAPAVCIFGGEDPPPRLLPSRPPYVLNLLSRGIGAVAICEPANNGINSFPWLASLLGNLPGVPPILPPAREGPAHQGSQSSLGTAPLCP